MKKIWYQIRTAFSKVWQSLKNTIITHKKQTIAVIIVAIILLTPITTGYKDGGTRQFLSLTYQVTIWHHWEDTDELNDTGILYIREGTTVRILLIPIYDHTYLVAYKDGERIDTITP